MTIVNFFHPRQLNQQVLASPTRVNTKVFTNPTLMGTLNTKFKLKEMNVNHLHQLQITGNKKKRKNDTPIF